MGRFAFIVAAALCVAAPAAAQHDALAPVAARELGQMCAADAGRLWGVSLCGPLLVANPQTRGVWASEADPGGVLTPDGAGGYVGVLPQGVPIANTRVEWSGVAWTMLVSPVMQDDLERRVLLGHEAWHRVQPQLGFAAQSPANVHLEHERGRYFMRLEMRALATALRSRGVARRRAAQDALILRAARHRWFPDAAAQEIALERNEGLAAYTGVRLGAGAEAEPYAMRTLDTFDRHPSFARAYAVAVGPAYGLLLDEFRPAWRTQLGGGGPAEALAGVLRPAEPDNARVAEVAARYGGPVVAGEERQRAEAQAVRVSALRQRYNAAERPVQGLRLDRPRFEFNPNQITPIDGLGNYYETLIIRDAWGEARATQGAVITADFSMLLLAEPAPDGLSGPGWTISPAAGVQIVPAPPAAPSPTP